MNANPDKHSAPLELTQGQVDDARAGRGKHVFVEALKKAKKAGSAKARPAAKPQSKRRS